MHANTLSKYPRLDSRIVEALAQGTPLSIQELAKHLHHKREDAVNIALKSLLLKGQVQRVGLSHRYRLSPTQSARSVEKHLLCEGTAHHRTITM